MMTIYKTLTSLCIRTLLFILSTIAQATISYTYDISDTTGSVITPDLTFSTGDKVTFNYF